MYSEASTVDALVGGLIYSMITLKLEEENTLLLMRDFWGIKVIRLFRGSSDSDF